MDASVLWLLLTLILTQVQRSYMSNRFRPRYHISAPLSWLNHPSGFTVFNGQFHIFYQYHPYHVSWGHMRWGHVASKNLIDWELFPTALYPYQSYDSHGCLSGTALVYNDHLTLVYTGSGTKNSGHQTQNVAVSSDGYNFKKYLYNPVIRDAPNFNKGFRSPKVWRFRDTWYMMVGSSSYREYGQLLLYTSNDIFNWKLNGTLVESYGDMGHIWESPDIIQLGGYDVLMISVQGIQTDGYRFRNLYQTGYVINSFDYTKARFVDIEVSTATYHELDYGHDFYAAQTLRTHDGRTLLIAWLGMWGNEFREAKYGWAGMLTLMRELTMNSQGRILMNPVREAIDLRVGVMEDSWYHPGQMFYAETKTFELLINSTTMWDVVVEFDWGDNNGYKIGYSSSHGYITVDRGGEDGVRRADWSPGDDLFLRIFVDSSSIEVFCGEGEVVFSSRIYPKRMMFVKIGGETRVHVIQYRLRSSADFDQHFPTDDTLIA